MTDPAGVIWHDLECGSYRADLALWTRLAAGHAGPILDIGAGTGRVALALARAGHAVTALDLDGELLAALARRAGALPVTTIQADARQFAGDARFGLCIVPMQTVQLLGGADGRRRFIAAARDQLTADGVIAMAIADAIEPFDVAAGFPEPLPDVGEIDGTVYCSRPVAVRMLGTRYMLERRREIVTPDGRLTAERDEILLDVVTADALEQDGRAVGCTVLAREVVPETDDYVGSTVVMLGV